MREQSHGAGDHSLGDLKLDARSPGWHCGWACQKSNPDCIEQPSYLCGQCGYFTAEDSSKCPRCGRFAENVGDESCIDCGGPVIGRRQGPAARTVSAKACGTEPRRTAPAIPQHKEESTNERILETVHTRR